MTGKHGYIAMYKGKQVEVYTNDGIYAAKVEAAKLLKAKKTSDVIIALCEKPNGEEVIHHADY